MTGQTFEYACRSANRVSRRTLLQTAGCGAASWLSGLSRVLARDAEQAPRGERPKSLILLWMQGGPSQLETFDPHPGSPIGGETQAIATANPGVEIASGLEQVADVMDQISLVRSVTSKEGDHERATYNTKTGFRPDPTLVHPSIGAVLCHQFQGGAKIPTHVTISSGQFPGRGGYLGDQYDAFKIGDPQNPIPDVKASVGEKRFQRRLTDLFNVVEAEFARGRLRNADAQKTLHRVSMRAARTMMSSAQLKAFDVSHYSQAERDAYGDSAFGRGCLAARGLIEAGVRCVEVTLNGWDSHINNHELQAGWVATLDPAYAALLRDLKARDLLDSTMVVWAGEFGRTPRINLAEGRDHWPHGFTVALSGGGIRPGVVYGETAADPKLDEGNPLQDVKQPRNIQDVHATILKAFGVDSERMLDTPIGRPMAISEGTPITELLL
ncbi:MAG TPA: DUF1501 domain-containing protein [Planctomycetaceae bacterium]|nr:hypothetical protein [Blastopirellula sp.]HAY82022.1 DUF1501 domain-containing protein [Planctomycetaceae bacterium]